MNSQAKRYDRLMPRTRQYILELTASFEKFQAAGMALLRLMQS